MNRHGICWYYSQTTHLPLFVWRDRDAQHPAHLFGAELIEEAPKWIQLTHEQLRNCARVSSNWPPAAIQYTMDRKARLGLRKMMQHAGWLEREIKRLGYDFTPPLERIAS